MLEKWEKLEKLINVLLERLRAFLIATYFKVIPAKAIDKYKQAKAWLIQKIIETIQKTKTWLQAQKDLKQQRKDFIKQKIQLAKETAQKLKEQVKALKSWRPRPPTKQDFKELWQAIKDFPPQLWRLLWFVEADKRPYVATAIVILGSGLMVISILSIHHLKQSGYFREPAAVVREYKKVRPEYYHQYDRTMKIHSVNFPVYIESARGAKMVRMDLTLTTNNKYTRNYLNKNYHMVQDRLNSRLEPMIPDFPIEEEGKEIIKSKVKEEIDSLIKELKIDGRVQSIHIHSILAG